ncbi:MAG: hypothetical protein Kow00129_03390 [Thermoleophilia bacterium]
MSWLNRLLGFFRNRKTGGERLLYVTDKAPFQTPEHSVGSLVPFEGGLYEITRWTKGKKIYLSRGGSVVQWEVWGRPVDDEMLADSVAEAAQKILDQEHPPSDQDNRD